MMRSLYSAVSGLKTHQTRMDVIGNNIANVNTEAFKASTVTFSEIMYQTTSSASSGNGAAGTGGVNAKQIGLGVTTGATNISITSAGAAQTTGNPFDLKLSDSQSTNFFVVSDGTNNFFTRSGSFYVDGNGYLCMSSTGYTLMGWQVDANTGEIRKDVVSPLQVMAPGTQTSSPEATTKAYMSGVLDKNDSNVLSDKGYAMNLTFYDELGYSYTAKFSVKPQERESGSYRIELSDIIDQSSNSILYGDNAQFAGTDIETLFGTSVPKTIDGSVPVQTNKGDLEAGKVYYDNQTQKYMVVTENGSTEAIISGVDGTNIAKAYFSYVDEDGMNKNISVASAFGFDAPDGATVAFDKNNPEKVAGSVIITDYPLQFNTDDGSFQSIITDGRTDATLSLSALDGKFKDIDIDFSKTMNFNNGGTSTLKVVKGDLIGDGTGKKLGALTGVTVDMDGKIYGSYDNGNTVLLCQIAAAQFANASGLEKVGNSCYRTTLNSGEFDGIGIDITADGSSMSTGELEMSNVDLSAQFTDMIVTQRGFQANSRVITTSDSLLEELINLKR